MKAKHELKIDQEYFKAVKDGRKKFEIRKDDRDYHVGDLLVLREYNPNCRSYTDESIKVEITYLTDYAQRNDHVVLGIEVIQEGEALTEIKKVVIPKFVAEFLGSHWEDGEPAKEDKADLIRHQEQYIRSFGTSELKNWIVKADNFILFVEAVMNGYEVEKEKLYYVELPLKKMLNGCGRLGEGYGGEIKVLFTQIELQPNWKTKFTEQEIKSIDERYWAFAVEVEGEE